MHRLSPQLLLFWDYDTQWGADRSRSGNAPKHWGNLDFENTEHLLEFHADSGLPACFAVVGAAALDGDRPYHDPEQIRRIHAAGHEIASHGLHHEWIPGLGIVKLLEVLRTSKDALEQCIGAPVVTFVPPFNQPFDDSRRLSFSLSERRVPKSDRIDVATLCAALRDTGYLACRVACRPMHLRVVQAVTGRRVDRPRAPMTINGVTCVRLVTAAGFTDATNRVVDSAIAHGGVAIAYGHPHALRADCTQSVDNLVPFLARVADLSADAKIHVALPRELVGINEPATQASLTS